MPEGPEVETVKQGLLSLIGSKIDHILVSKHKKYNNEVKAIHNLQGSIISNLTRAGKFLIWEFELINKRNKNHQFLYALNHLGMTGVWRIFNQQKWLKLGFKLPLDHETLEMQEKHYKIAFYTNNHEVIVFSDVRTFGRFSIFDNKESIYNYHAIKDLGPDILDVNFDRKEFIARVRGKTSTPKRKEIGKILLDSNVVSGCGNIYKSEALFRSKIHPLTPANKISDSKLTQLADSLGKVANLALKNKGSSLRNYNTVDGYNGLMQNEFLVYDRENLPCFTCKTLIEKFKQGDRSSYCCPNCQKM
jgi:formamidopyrimidine-DNA glycosylase